MVAQDDRLPADPGAPGLNVAGLFGAALGIGEAGRLMLLALRAARIPYRKVGYSAPVTHYSDDLEPDEPTGGDNGFETNLVCLNPPELRDFAMRIGPEFFGGRYTIGHWWWEVSEFPPTMRAGFGFVDEVWVGSDFVGDAIARETTKPVVTIPIPVRTPEPAARSRAQLGLPSGFLFMFLFDFFSIVERKNPLATINAFQQAFAPTDNAALAIKTINGEFHPTELAALQQAAADRSDIHVIDGYLAPQDRDAMIATCDCYVSLHRSEGFGLTLAEAMALAKPVVATGYSGNLTFMNEENSYLVPYAPTTVPPGCDPYPAGAAWAEPDVATAAAMMRRVYDGRDEAAAKGERARADIATNHSAEASGAFISRRLGEIEHRTVPSPIWRELAVTRAAVDGVTGRLRDAERSQHRVVGPLITTSRTLLLRVLGAGYRESLRATLLQLAIVQQQLVKQLDDLDARIRELERR